MEPFFQQLIALEDSASGNLHVFGPRKPEEAHKPVPWKSSFRKFSEKASEPLCPILCTCMPFSWAAAFLLSSSVSTGLRCQRACGDPGGGFQKRPSALCAACVGIGNGSVRPICIYFSQKVILLQMDLRILVFLFRASQILSVFPFALNTFSQTERALAVI